MTLSDFIRTNKNAILREWDAFARAQLIGGSTLSPAEVRDSAERLLQVIADDIDAVQSPEARAGKSRGEPSSALLVDLGVTHATHRMEMGASLVFVASEFRALRASVIRQWEKSLASPEAGTERGELTRFNEAIDETLMKSVEQYTTQTAQVREMFLGMLGHDLRNPLASIHVSASMLLRPDGDAEKVHRAALLILNSTERMRRMVRDLIDLTRSRLGSGIPVLPGRMELAESARLVLDEFVAARPDRELRLEVAGDTYGVWDKDRLEQLLSNLIGNALQYGAEGSPITVRVAGEVERVSLAVHNLGPPIPPAMLRTIFSPMSRGKIAVESSKGTSLGLGLFISHEIVGAHDGQITVASSTEDGTTFTVTLPRVSRGSEASSGAPKR